MKYVFDFVYFYCYIYLSFVSLLNWNLNWDCCDFGVCFFYYWLDKFFFFFELVLEESCVVNKV